MKKPQKQYWVKWIILVLAACLIYGVYDYWQRCRLEEESHNQLLQRAQSQADLKDLNTSMLKILSEDPQTIIQLLNGTALAIGSEVTVYTQADKTHSYLDLSLLSSLPIGYQYQLWQKMDDGFHSLGILDYQTDLLKIEGIAQKGKLIITKETEERNNPSLDEIMLSD